MSKNNVLPILWLTAILLMAYTNALTGGSFQFDDFNVIVDNPRVHDWPAWWADLNHGIRPLLKFSYTLNWTMGPGITGFHVTNLTIHWANTLLGFHLAQRYLVTQPRLHEKAPAIAFGTALLFAVHPIQTEAVTYLCGRSSSLMTMFYLAGLLANTRHTFIFRHLLTPLCFLFALATKETAITFPFALLIWDICSGQPWRRAWLASWSSWLLLAVASLYFLGNADYSAHLERSVQFNTLSGNLANTALATNWLLRQWSLPFWLNIDPDLPLAHTLDASTVWPLILLMALAVFMWTNRTRDPWRCLAIAWLLLQIVPLHLFLPRLDIANERQMYLVTLPLSLALMIELHRAFLNRPRTRIALIGFLLTGCLILTIARNQDYRNEIALWEATVALSPGKSRVHNNLGYAYAQSGRIEEARRAYERALQINPLEIRAHGNLNALKLSPPTSGPQILP